MSTGQREIMLAEAALTEISALKVKYTAALVREDSKGLESIKNEAHAWLDAVFDHMDKGFVLITQENSHVKK